MGCTLTPTFGYVGVWGYVWAWYGRIWWHGMGLCGGMVGHVVVCYRDMRDYTLTDVWICGGMGVRGGMGVGVGMVWGIEDCTLTNVCY